MRFRVLHQKPGVRGFICQKQVYPYTPWINVGIRSRHHFVVSYVTKKRSWYDTNEDGRGAQEEAERRLDFEVVRYRNFLDRQREKREFRPKVIKEWP